MTGTAHRLEQGNLLEGVGQVQAGRREAQKKAHRTSRAATKAPRRVGFVAALELVVKYGRERAKEVGRTALSQCPRCGHVGPTAQDFGTRVIRGERRPQSWCRSCRSLSLPPLSSVSSTAPRSAGAPSSTGSASTRARATSSTAEGWLFPPEALGPRPM